MARCRALQPAEFQAIMSAFHGRCAERDKALFATGTNTGLRVKELCALTFGDVLSAGEIKNVLTLSRSKTKGRTAAREIPLNNTAREHLARAVLFRQRRGCFALNTPVFGIGPVRAYQAIKAAVRAAGLSDAGGVIGTHTMRKTFANDVHRFFLNQLREGNVVDPLLETSRALGHATVQNTVAYLPASAERTRTAIFALEESFS